MAEPFSFIDTSQKLNALCQAMRDAGEAAIDTEFVWDRTYYAELGLIQVGLPNGDVSLIDPLAINDLSPLGDILADASVIKILHDAVQDLMILCRATGRTAVSIFDSRTAAGFCGMPCVISLQGLLESLLDISLHKGATRTDWTARPLSQVQLDYAVEDVKYLPAAVGKLKAIAKDKGLYDWMMEEMTLLNEPTLYTETPVEDAWKRFSAADKLSPQGLAALRVLATWQESTARQRNRPRSRIVSDKELISVAFALPRNMDQLKNARNIHPRTVHRWGRELLAAVEQSLALPLPDDLSDSNAKRNYTKEELAAFIDHVKGLAQARGIDPQLMGNKKEMTRLFTETGTLSADDHRVLRGWRGELVGDSLRPYLQRGD
jgi:ribonuclease D